MVFSGYVNFDLYIRDGRKWVVLQDREEVKKKGGVSQCCVSGGVICIKGKDIHIVRGSHVVSRGGLTYESNKYGKRSE